MNEPTYGVTPSEEFAHLSGREFLQGMIEGRFPRPPISRTLNFRLVEVGDGFAAFEGEPSEAVLNPLGIVHGGWALTLIDSATGCAGLSLLPAGSSFTTIETKANFSRPIAKDQGRLRCEAKVVSRGRQIISVESWVRDAQGKLFAHGTSTLMVLQAR
jgi:uncharacterized protein (TIGR00369 family)